jgi:predicted permease
MDSKLCRAIINPVMGIFLLLFTNLIPLYILIGLGFVAGRWLHVDRHSLGNLVIFICMPIMAFGFIVQLEFKPEYAALPFVSLGIATIVTFVMLAIARRVYQDSSANLLSMCASMGNTGYFGLPLVLLLFDEQWVAIYTFMMLGITVHEATVGYYVAARGNFSVGDSLRKLARFPVIYVIPLALLVNYLHLPLPKQFFTYWVYFKGCYVVLGMMIIGVALSKIEKIVIGPRFLALTFVGKFLLWPALALAFNALDVSVLHLFNADIYQLLMVMALVPPAANITAFAAQLNLKPEKAATTVLAGTVFALVYIPAMLVLLGLYQ